MVQQRKKRNLQKEKKEKDTIGILYNYLHYYITLILIYLYIIITYLSRGFLTETLKCLNISCFFTYFCVFVRKHLTFLVKYGII
jgi:hypothetical protein